MNMVKFALKDKTAKTVIVFGLICFFTIFLRVYHFSDWLRFNSDQARDAGIVRDMIENNNVPLLGPIAGGTLFQLGPAFYYFQFVGAKLFGVMPDKMAYGDLLFGILSVPLAFFLFLRYFKKNTSLMLAALYATSFFAVQYSRFAWNPNFSVCFSFIRFLCSRMRKAIKFLGLLQLEFLWESVCNCTHFFCLGCRLPFF